LARSWLDTKSSQVFRVPVRVGLQEHFCHSMRK
jgi:hypothetical protein